MTGIPDSLTTVLRQWADREQFMARATRTATPATVVPPGADPADWRLYISAGAAPVLAEIEALGIWSPQ